MVFYCSKVLPSGTSVNRNSGKLGQLKMKVAAIAAGEYY